MRHGRVTLRASTIALVAALLGAGTTNAQDARAALRRGTEAFDDADYGTAARYLSEGLDPAGGTLDSTWMDGVHRLVESLYVMRQDSIAAVWAIWAIRLHRDFRVDDLTYPPRVVATFESARSFVEGTSDAAAITEASWEWAAGSAAARGGRIRIERSDIGVSGRIEGGDILMTGIARPLAPGSYSIAASASGYLPARITTEVLPGITTVLRLELLPTTAGQLYVAARPWGTVYVDGRRVGYTTLAGHLVSPGPHEVRVERQGYAAFDTLIAVREQGAVRLGTVALVDADGVTPPAWVGDSDPMLAQALSALEATETERGVDLLREYLFSLPPGVQTDVRVPVELRLAEASWALGLEDSARAHFSDAIVLDPFLELDTAVLNPETAALYRDARLVTLAVGLRAPADTMLTPATDRWPVAVAVGSPGQLRLWLRPADSVLTSRRVSGPDTAFIALANRFGGSLSPGSYRVEAELRVADGRVARKSLEVTVERVAVDTVQHEPPLPDSLFRAETSKGMPNGLGIARGLALGAVAATLPYLIGNSELNDGLPPGAIVLGGTVAIADIWLNRAESAIPENIEYNASLRAEWAERNATIAADNEALRQRAAVRLVAREAR